VLEYYPPGSKRRGTRQEHPDDYGRECLIPMTSKENH